MSYETDFVQWTRDQAALLRALDPSPTGLDADNLAEEIEALGRIEISNMSRHLYQLLNNLLLLAAGAPEQNRWIRDAYSAHTDVALASSPSLEHHLDLARTYKLARRGAVDMLVELKIEVPDFPADCPLTVAQLVDEDFDFPGAIKLLERGNG
ncbi:DUF29 domain-containing protein [Rhizobium sp. WSM1274]|uniref:DUF29 domain-containing protein n=1 Tax=Rhizobium sp. WSM1274 TaxID=3138254 RepID=UPI0021A648EA|nr:DUF29 domain-containing protein [Rhizobium leguminosarum]UWU29211.1 DUF29 domain-containing protein [Rhizobium leguminosarum bv. viciae]